MNKLNEVSLICKCSKSVKRSGCRKREWFYILIRCRWCAAFFPVLVFLTDTPYMLEQYLLFSSHFSGSASHDKDEEYPHYCHWNKQPYKWILRPLFAEAVMIPKVNPGWKNQKNLFIEIICNLIKWKIVS